MALTRGDMAEELLGRIRPELFESAVVITEERPVTSAIVCSIPLLPDSDRPYRRKEQGGLRISGVPRHTVRAQRQSRAVGEVPRQCDVAAIDCSLVGAQGCDRSEQSGIGHARSIQRNRP